MQTLEIVEVAQTGVTRQEMVDAVRNAGRTIGVRQGKRRGKRGFRMTEQEGAMRLIHLRKRILREKDKLNEIEARLRALGVDPAECETDRT